MFILRHTYTYISASSDWSRALVLVLPNALCLLLSHRFHSVKIAAIMHTISTYRLIAIALNSIALHSTIEAHQLTSRFMHTYTIGGKPLTMVHHASSPACNSLLNIFTHMRPPTCTALMAFLTSLTIHLASTPVRYIFSLSRSYYHYVYCL
jgi:hypothetical protein